MEEKEVMGSQNVSCDAGTGIPLACYVVGRLDAGLSPLAETARRHVHIIVLSKVIRITTLPLSIIVIPMLHVSFLQF
jgi:hypothetical protein